MKNWSKKSFLFIVCALCMSLTYRSMSYAAETGEMDTFIANESQDDISNQNMAGQEEITTEGEEPKTEEVLVEEEELETEEIFKQPETKVKIMSVRRSVEDIISIELPMVTESGNSPFDFILDPQQLITATRAAKYGGLSFEEGKTLYFKNNGGEYDYSSRSDYLTVRNRSTVPVKVTVEARVVGYEGFSLTTDPFFEEDKADSIYLALKDDEGNTIPIMENGEAIFNIELSPAPDNAYTVRYDENKGKYVYETAGNTDAASFDSCSFCIVGACNPNGSWWILNTLPTIVVTWKAEPIVEEKYVTDTVSMVEEVVIENTSDGNSEADGISTEDILGEDAGNGDTATGDAPGEDAGNGDTATGDVSGEDAGNGDTATGDVSGEDAGNGDTATEDVSGEDAGNGDTATEDVSGEDAGNGNTAMENMLDADIENGDITTENVLDENTETSDVTVSLESDTGQSE